MPDVSKWIKSQFYTSSWTFASDVKKSQFSRSYCRLTFMPRLHLNFQNQDFTQVFDGWPSFRAKGLRRVPPNLHFATCLDVRAARSLQKVARAQKKFTFHHMLGRSKRTISADGCCGQRSFDHRFAHPTHDLRRGLPKDKQDPHFATRLGVRHAAEGNVSSATAWLSLLSERNRLKQKNWRILILQEFRYNLITWKLAELLCSNSCVTPSVQMTLQAGVL